MQHAQKYVHYPFINTGVRNFTGRGIYVLSDGHSVSLYGLEPYSLGGCSVIRAYRYNPGPEELFFSDPADLCIRGKVVGNSG